MVKYDYLLKRNNLKALMRSAGISGVQMAEIRGVTPETVSRHVTSKTSMKMDDLVAYSEILDCKAEDIIYEPKPMTMFGTADDFGNVTEQRLIEDARIYSSYGDPDEMVCILKRKGSAAYSHDEIYFVAKDPIQNRYVDESALNKRAVFKVADAQRGKTLNLQERLALGDNPAGQIGFGYVSQDAIPRDANINECRPTFSIRNAFTLNTGFDNVELEWLTPVMGGLFVDTLWDRG